MPNSPDSLKGAAAPRNGASDAAALERTVRAEPDNLTATQELAGLLFRTGRAAEAGLGAPEDRERGDRGLFMRVSRKAASRPG